VGKKPKDMKKKFQVFSIPNVWEQCVLKAFVSSWYTTAVNIGCVRAELTHSAQQKQSSFKWALLFSQLFGFLSR